MTHRMPRGELVQIDDTRLHVVARGDGVPVLVLHGGPGLDHTIFGSHLDGLADQVRLLFVDQRSQGRSDRAPLETVTLTRMAKDVSELADAMGLDRYAVLGHSFGAFVALQHAVDFPGAAAATIISSGLPSERFLERIQDELDRFEPAELREQVVESWANEQWVETQEGAAALIRDQLPFHFADPRDPRIAEMIADLADAVYAPDVIRLGAREGYGGIEVEDRLHTVPQPVLVVTGLRERTCCVEGAEAIAAGIPGAELVVLEHSAHMPFAEEPENYVAAVRDFLTRRLALSA
jgi:proline iminopeptidase